MVRVSRYVVPLGVMILAIACHPATAQTIPAVTEMETPRPDIAEATIPAEVDADGKQIVAGLNQFSGEIFTKLALPKGDAAISPASISTAFGLVYAGARGDTADEIASTLHYPTTLSNFHESYGKLLASMRFSGVGRTMEVNNALWLQNDMTVPASYQALVIQHYQAGLKRADFKADRDAARLRINNWVLEKTHNKISDLIGPDDLRPTTRAVLVNSFYFKADWADPFDKSATKTGRFKATGKAIDLPLMNQRNYYQYAEHGGVQMLALPYRGGETEMVVLLPKTGELAKLEKKVAGKGFMPWLAHLDQAPGKDVIVTVPKFQIESRYDEVGDSLKAMGMPTALSAQADFGNLKPFDRTSPRLDDQPINISKVIHQTFIEVAEKGTEAAAATAVIMAVIVTGRRNPAPPKIFRADHPFLFLIRDRRTKAIMFVGRFAGQPPRH